MKITSESVASRDQQKNAGPNASVMALMRKAGADPDLDVDAFVRKVSNAFHEVQAETYDESVAPQIRNAVTPVLEELLRDVALPGPFSVLDLGCGTGFAAEALLDRLGPSIGALHCADISEAMLQRCRERLSGRDAGTRITYGAETAETLAAGGARFDLVVSCSLLHHILDLQSFFAAVHTMIARGGYFLALHEPSSKFARNQECTRLAAQFRRTAMLERCLRPSLWLSKLRCVVTRKPPFSMAVSSILIGQGVIRHPLTWLQLASLVDIHDPAVPAEVRCGEAGFDPQAFVAGKGGFAPVRWKSYAFLGDVDASSAGHRLLRRSQSLAEKYPEDGANFAVLWRREER